MADEARAPAPDEAETYGPATGTVRSQLVRYRRQVRLIG
ncbi:hypothetical protein FOZG_17549 [Fusarium oxysporum Fo47]|uniref:Uncharacterized protein n=1 Tax=Fusarium oxysporum Fo47 TaxID=660027 RepID=W9JEF7_FUSOX|nr:hypothetical protein FOZG_17549 [Fusarium oxysporum Fo47]